MEPFSALAFSVHTHAAIHALTRAVLDCSAEDLDVSAVILLERFVLSFVVSPDKLEDASVACNICRKPDLLGLNRRFIASAWEITFEASFLIS